MKASCTITKAWRIAVTSMATALQIVEMNGYNTRAAQEQTTEKMVGPKHDQRDSESFFQKPHAAMAEEFHSMRQLCSRSQKSASLQLPRPGLQ